MSDLNVLRGQAATDFVLFSQKNSRTNNVRPFLELNKDRGLYGFIDVVASGDNESEIYVRLIQAKPPFDSYKTLCSNLLFVVEETSNKQNKDFDFTLNGIVVTKFDVTLADNICGMYTIAIKVLCFQDLHSASAWAIEREVVTLLSVANKVIQVR